MEELLKKILSELRKANRRLESMEEILSQAEIEDEDVEENEGYRTLDGGFFNG